MKTIDQVKDEVCQKYGHANFREFKVKCIKDAYYLNYMIPMMDEITLAYAEQFMPKWIDVKDEPKAGVPILVCDHEKKWHSTAKYVHKKYYADDDKGSQICPTHWQYLTYPNE